MLTLMCLRNAPSTHGYGVPQVSATKECSWYMMHMGVVCRTTYSAGAECVASSWILLSGMVRDSTPS